MITAYCSIILASLLAAAALKALGFRRYILTGFAILMFVATGFTLWIHLSSKRGPFVANFDQLIPDEIDSFGDKFDPNGKWPMVDLPEDASPKQVIEALAKCVPDQRELFVNCRLVQNKTVTNPASALNGYSVALILSEKGKQIFVVYQYEKGTKPGWLVRSYDRQGNWPKND